jgi:hypothetical protein
MRRADFFFAFADKNEVYGEFLVGAANGVESG